VIGKPTIDPALLDLFRAEVETHLPALSEGLLALEKDPRQPKRLEALMRAAHSVKGAAKIVGVEPAVRVAHVLEDCFVAAQKGQITLGSDAVDVLLGGVDALHRIAPPGGAPAEEPDEEALGQLLNKIAAVKQGAPPAPAPAAKAPAPAAAPPPGPPTVRPAGDLDGREAEAVRGRLAELLAGGATRVRLDFAAVGDVGPEGLAVLARAARAGVAFEVVNAGPPVRDLLRLTRLDRAFPAGDGRGA
jgi:two-component system sensor histidine kinase and response regulator WspE